MEQIFNFFWKYCQNVWNFAHNTIYFLKKFEIQKSVPQTFISSCWIELNWYLSNKFQLHSFIFEEKIQTGISLWKKHEKNIQNWPAFIKIYQIYAFLQIKAIGGVRGQKSMSNLFWRTHCCGFNAFYGMSKFNSVPKIWPIQFSKLIGSGILNFWFFWILLIFLLLFFRKKSLKSQ